jgi:hypothetical protein
VAAASHAQLSLIGWGSNQLWDQSALGSWGESICYDPNQIQGLCAITDVRPLMVRPMNGRDQWSWTNNVGGGDFFRLFDTTGTRIPHSAMQATYHRYGPCLTEVTYAGRVGSGIQHSETMSLGRTDDIVRGTCRLRLDVTEPIEFSRFVIFQVGADTYNHTRETKFALGNEEGLVEEWATQGGGDVYRTEARQAAGRIPWISLHEGNPPRKEDKPGAWANRGIVIRSWKAQLGGKTAAPWIAEHGTPERGGEGSTLDLVPPPGVTRLEVGDYVEATIETLIMPQAADDYYGPNEALREALAKDGNTWKMIHREATANDRQVTIATGVLKRIYPDIHIETEADAASFQVIGGIGFVPLTFSGLTGPGDFVLKVNGQRIDQSVHGNDFWQTDYDPISRSWSQTYNIPVSDKQSQHIRFSKSASQ